MDLLNYFGEFAFATTFKLTTVAINTGFAVKFKYFVFIIATIITESIYFAVVREFIVKWEGKRAADC